jgi:hypothetical protein
VVSRVSPRSPVACPSTTSVSELGTNQLVGCFDAGPSN